MRYIHRKSSPPTYGSFDREIVISSWRRDSMTAQTDTLDTRSIAISSIRWIARIYSLASMALIAMFATSGGAAPTAKELVALAFFPVGVVAGFLVAWWREGLGGAISVISLAIFYAWMTLMGRFPGGPYFILFSVPGFLFLANWMLQRSLTLSSGSSSSK
jgi:hypothetical protein